MDKLILEEMAFFGRHGVLPEENRLGQKYIVSLVLWLDLEAAAQKDDLDKTVNYAELYERVRLIVEGEPFQLIEALAGHLATDLLGAYTGISEITVRVTKPNPPVAIHFKGVSVELHRTRTVGGLQ